MSKDTPGAPSPAQSSTFLPLGTKGRRSSLSSIASRSNLDRETLNHALDQIHTSASQTTTLTTFNDFAPPPSTEAKGLANQIGQNGLAGMYSRFKSSVTGAKPTPTPISASKEGSSKQSSLKDDQKDSATTPSQGSRSPTVSTKDLPVMSPPLQSPASSSHKAAGPFGISSPTAQKGRYAKSPAASLASSLAEDKEIASNEIPSKSAIVRDRVQETSKSGSQVKQALSPTAAALPKSSSDPALDPKQSPSKELPQATPGSKLSTPIPSPTRIIESTQLKKANLEALDKASIRLQNQNASQQRATDTSKQSSGPGKAQLELPGFRPSQATTTATDSQSSRTPSLAPSLPVSRTNVVASRDPERSREHVRESSIVQEMRRKILSRDFWMKDENAKVCFNCGEGFTTFRRKHHCRLCGQIYCNNCTNLISGKPFGQASKLRVCKTCEAMLYGDDSSDYSEDDEFSSSPQAKQLRFSAVDQAGGFASDKRELEPSQDPELRLGLARSLSFRKEKDPMRRALAGVNFDRPNVLARPSSSRSLKSLSGRPHSSSQKRRRPRHQHMRSLGMADHPPGAPFHGDFLEETSKVSDLPAFHKDSIIDPDLAPFMSDEGSSEEEGPTIAGNLHSEMSATNSMAFNGLVGALQKGRPKTPAKAHLDGRLAGLDVDNISVASSRTGPIRRGLGARPMSVGSVSKYSNSPRLVRSDNLFAASDRLGASIFETNHSSDAVSSFPPLELPTERRSDDATAGISGPSLEHIKRLLQQFLRDYKIAQEKAWLKALVPILLRCAGEVDPNIQRGDAIDIRHYVKLKKAPGGSPKDTSYVSGVVFTKNIALKNMKRNIRQPRILLISFPLIYARHQQHFMSLDPVIAQEREYLRNLVKRIVALHPNVLLVQRNVSGIALQYLQEAGVTVAYNVKESVMQALARCTQTRIVSSIERLTMEPDSLGTCGSFDVRTFVNLGSKKNYISVSGCQKDLGCTIVLRGAEETVLKDLKWITEFMCYVAYNARLETYLIRDQFVSGPASTLISKNAEDGKSEEAHGSESQSRISDNQSDQLKNSHVRGSFHTMVAELQNRTMSVSPFVNFPEPFLVLRGRDQEEQMERLRALRESQGGDTDEKVEDKADVVPQNFELVKPEMVYTAAQNASPQVREILHAIHSVEYDKAAHTYATLKRRWETYVHGANQPFNPLNHQKVVVLFSIVSTPTSDACDGPDLLGLDFYQEHDIDGSLEPDVPLGEYIERLCNQAQSPCTANRCDKTMLDHHRQYVHGDGQISIHIFKHPSKLKGMENTILMWSSCRKCEEETPVVPMSSSTWKYSLGKYLELSFWSRPMHPRADLCDHDIYRDHVRYFGFKGYAVKVQYDPINIVEVIVPRGTITWNVEKDLRLKNDIFTKGEDRISRFMSSVKLRIKSINLDNIKEEKVEACKAEIEDMLKRVNEEYDALIKKLREKYVNSKYYELIPLNRAARFMQEKVAEWDSTFADFERNYFPSEKDIQQLAALQFKRAYLDQDGSSFDEAEDEKQPATIEINEGQPLHGDLPNDPEKDPVEAFQSRNSSTFLNNIGSAPQVVLGSTPGDLDNQTNQVVEGLDLAVPAGSPSSNPMTLGHTGSPARLQSMDLAPSPPRQGISPTHAPSRLHPDVVAKVEEMQSDAKHGLEHGGEARSGLHAGLSPLADRRLSPTAPSLFRAQSQPAKTIPQVASLGAARSVNEGTSADPSLGLSVALQGASNVPADGTEKKSPERLGTNPPKGNKTLMRSMIPRAIGYKGSDSKVTTLAKHFEQMTKEFERERVRERRQRAAKWGHARAYPAAASKPVVVVYRDATEAAKERETSNEELRQASSEEHRSQKLQEQTPNDEQTENEGDNNKIQREETTATDTIKMEDNPTMRSYPASEVDLLLSDTEQTGFGKKVEEMGDQFIKSPAESLNELVLDIPKHERSSLMKMLTSFWSERSASGWTPLEYPLTPYDHIFADSDVIVREDEPSTLLAFAMESDDYKNKVQKFRERVEIAEKEQLSVPDADGTAASAKDVDVERVMLGKTATHMRYQFQAGSARMQCKVFYAEAFDAIRRKCGVSERFVESLSRCFKWDSKGGKTKSLFLKTLDERFILKSLSAVETQAFLKFAPDYFDYMSKCLFHSLPSALAKMLGFYQIIIKNPLTGTDFNYFLQVMENVFYEGPSNRMFDLKGSMRNRKIQSTGEKDEVLLDENLLEYVSQSPVYVRNHSNSILASSISNDTLFFSKQNVMDYSLIVGLYEDRKELLVGIIDYIRTYTWDKKLETWIKDRGKHKATVRSPKEYRNRFRASIPRYFPLAPSCWQIFGVQRVGQASHQLEVGGNEEDQETAEQSQTETAGEQDGE